MAILMPSIATPSSLIKTLHFRESVRKRLTIPVVIVRSTRRSRTVIGYALGRVCRIGHPISARYARSEYKPRLPPCTAWRMLKWRFYLLGRVPPSFFSPPEAGLPLSPFRWITSDV